MLLDRFRHDTGGRDDDDLRGIIDNLNRILNTKKGYGYWLDGYGIGDYNVYRGRDQIVETLLAEIQENIERFEPRVRLDLVEEVDSESPFRLRFQVSGKFVGREKPFFIVVDSMRHDVRIERQ